MHILQVPYFPMFFPSFLFLVSFLSIAADVSLCSHTYWTAERENPAAPQILSPVPQQQILDEAGYSYSPLTNSPATLHPEDPALRSTVPHQVSELGVFCCRCPTGSLDPRATSGGPCHCSWLPFSATSSNIVCSVTPRAGRKQQAEASHGAGSLPQGSWWEFSHPFDFPLRRACQAGDNVLQQGWIQMEKSVLTINPGKIVSKMYSCTFLYIQIPLFVFCFRHKYL